jgi:hypothetical protein
MVLRTYLENQKFSTFCIAYRQLLFIVFHACHFDNRQYVGVAIGIENINNHVYFQVNGLLRCCFG